MSLMEAVALTYLVSAVIVIGVVPMLLSDAPGVVGPGRSVRRRLVEERAWINSEHRRVRSVLEYPSAWRSWMPTENVVWC